MVKKGLMSKVQADADDSRVDGARIALEKVEEEKRVLVDYMKKRTVQDLNAKLAEAKRALERVKSQARAKLAQADADRLAKDSVYKQELSQKARDRGRNRQVHCPGAAGRPGRLLCPRAGARRRRLAAIHRGPGRAGPRRPKDDADPRPVPHARQRPRPRSHGFRTCTTRRTRATKAPGKRPRSASMPFQSEVSHGHVKTVDTVASQQDFFASDVKVLQDDGLHRRADGRPQARHERRSDHHRRRKSDEVLVVPVQSVVRHVSMGARSPNASSSDRDGQPELRDIVVGMSNQRLVEVEIGLKEGEQVVLNPGPSFSRTTAR